VPVNELVEHLGDHGLGGFGLVLREPHVDTASAAQPVEKRCIRIPGLLAEPLVELTERD
jgi:hypothetical protein